MRAVQFFASIPIYLQVMGDMKRDMAAGALPAGGRVDSVRALAARYGINLNTMQRACAELEREGLLAAPVPADLDRARLEALREEMARGLAQAYLEGMAGLGFGRAEAEARLKREGEE